MHTSVLCVRSLPAAGVSARAVEMSRRSMLVSGCNSCTHHEVHDLSRWALLITATSPHGTGLKPELGCFSETFWQPVSVWLGRCLSSASWCRG
jgi:hypothetical protein